MENRQDSLDLSPPRRQNGFAKSAKSAQLIRRRTIQLDDSLDDPENPTLPPSRWDHFSPGDPPKSTANRYTANQDLDEMPGPSKSEGKSDGSKKCPICLGAVDNLASTDNCDHEFCFVCLQEWTKIKSQCPLCKQPIKQIRFGDGERFDIPTPPPMVTARVRAMPPQSAEQLETRRQVDTLRALFASLGPDLVARRGGMLQEAATLTECEELLGAWEREEPRERLLQTAAFRRLAYERQLRVQPMTSGERGGRERAASPAFFRTNPAASHRIAHWLNRELAALLHSDSRAAIVAAQICRLLTKVHLDDPEFGWRVRMLMRSAVADQLCHELRHFARSPYDADEFYRRARYYRVGSEPRPVEAAAAAANNAGIMREAAAAAPPADDVVVVAESAELQQQVQRRAAIRERFERGESWRTQLSAGGHAFNFFRRFFPVFAAPAAGGGGGGNGVCASTSTAAVDLTRRSNSADPVDLTHGDDGDGDEPQVLSVVGRAAGPVLDYVAMRRLQRARAVRPARHSADESSDSDLGELADGMSFDDVYNAESPIVLEGAETPPPSHHQNSNNARSAAMETPPMEANWSPNSPAPSVSPHLIPPSTQDRQAPVTEALVEEQMDQDPVPVNDQLLSALVRLEKQSRETVAGGEMQETVPAAMANGRILSRWVPVFGPSLAPKPAPSRAEEGAAADADEIEVVCELKPRHLRTPPLVVLDDEPSPTAPVQAPLAGVFGEHLDEEEQTSSTSQPRRTLPSVVQLAPSGWLSARKRRSSRSRSPHSDRARHKRHKSKKRDRERRPERAGRTTADRRRSQSDSREDRRRRRSRERQSDHSRQSPKPLENGHP